MVVVKPFGPLLYESDILYSAVIKWSTLSRRSFRNFSSIYFARPARKSSTLILCPSLSHLEAILAFNSRSWSPVPILIWTDLVSVLLAPALAFFSFLFASYWYLPKSIIFPNGGLAFGAISIKSKPLLSASSRASFMLKTPRFLFSLSKTRSSFARIWLFILSRNWYKDILELLEYSVLLA